MSSLSLSFLLLSLSNLNKIVESEEVVAFAINTKNRLFKPSSLFETNSKRVSNLLTIFVIFVSGVSIRNIFLLFNNNTSTSNQICKAALQIVFDCVLFVLALVYFKCFSQKEKKLIQIKFKFNFSNINIHIHTSVDNSDNNNNSNIIECFMNDNFIKKNSQDNRNYSTYLTKSKFIKFLFSLFVVVQRRLNNFLFHYVINQKAQFEILPNFINY